MPIIPNMRVERVPVSDIVPYANNAKLHPDCQVEQILSSIDQFGFNDPIAIDENNVIIEGHGRLLAAKKLRMTEVPVIRLEHLDDEAKRAYILAHNKLTMNTDFDLDVLKSELDNIFDIDMSDFGFDAVPEEELEDVDVSEDDVPEDVPSRVAEGDVWQLGEHRLVCGDSTSAAVVDALMGDDVADMLLTDPPYNVDYSSKNETLALIGKQNSVQEDIKNDTFASSDEYETFLVEAIKTATSHVKDGGAFYIWFAAWFTRETFNACKKAGIDVRQCLYWVKNRIVLGRQDYQWQTEPCLYGWTSGAGHWFAPTRKEHNVFDDALDPRKMTKAQLLEEVQAWREQYPETDCIREDKPQVSGDHPTMKPVALFARLIRNSSRKGEIVLDVFGGSGTTLVACEQMDRKARVVELDPHYCNVIIERWEQLTGETAVLDRNINDDIG
jgi:DNA modification methylase